MSVRRCTRCVMDNASDPTIYFDEQGQCNYCTDALEKKDQVYFPNAEGEEKLQAMIRKLKQAGKGKEFDCIMGISGGLDSSYLAYLGCQWGLRILAVHIDDGYDTAISVRNIENLTRAAHLVMETVRPDRVQYDALIHAYMKAGVPNLAIPQDNILLAFLHAEAKKHDVHFFLSGGNYAMEYILQQGNTYNSMDVVNIKDIHHRFGTEGIDKLRFITSIQKWLSEKTGNLVEYRPLNYLDYNRKRAFQELKAFCDFEYYGGKHQENLFTTFLQHYWLPQKFHVDKRKSHYSSLIVSGQMTREEALQALEEPMYDPQQMDAYIAIIKERMGIGDEEFVHLMQAPVKQHTDYKTEKFATAVHKLRNRFFG